MLGVNWGPSFHYKFNIILQGGSAANTDGPTDDEDSDGRSHYSGHGNNTSNTGQSSNFSQTYRERRREAHTQVINSSFNVIFAFSKYCRLKSNML